MSTFHPFRSAASKAEFLALYEARAKRWPITSETRLVHTPSGRTFVRISGQAAAPPLVLLHGARGSSLMWIPNIAALSARYRTYALDTMGEMGLSVSHQPITRLEQLVTWLDEVLAVLVPQGSASLLGMSFGGGLASQYALRYPGRVHKLVLLSPAATVFPVSQAMIIRAALTLLPGITFRRKFYYWLLRDAVQSGPAGRARVDEAVADWAVAERCFRQLLLVPAPVLDDRTLSAWKVSTLFLVGENEKIYPAPMAVARLNRVAPQIKTDLIPGAGHDLWMVQATAVTGKILDYLEDSG